jgi:hypothetical protein
VEENNMRSDDIRRYSDGSINYDFYRARANALRAEAIALRAEAMRGMTLRGGVLIGATAVVITAFAVVPGRLRAVASAIRRALEAALEIG